MKKSLKITLITIAAVLLIAMLTTVIIFASRGFNKYVKRLEKAEYDVVVYEGDQLQNKKEDLELKGYEIKEYAVASKLDGTLSVATIIKFKNSSQAREYLENELGGTAAVRKGAVIITGSENAKNIALGK